MRLRLRFTKLGKIRFLGHRDLARCWERAIRRAELPIAYSEGVSPRPKVHFGLALPTGAASIAEYLDIDLREPIDITGLAPTLSEMLPVGVDVTAVSVVERSATALQAAVTSVTWEFGLTGVDAAQAADLVAELLARTEVPLTIERKGKRITEDVRGAILDITSGRPVTAHAVELPIGAAGVVPVPLTLEMAVRPRSLRPAEVLAVLGADERPNLAAPWVCRHEQWITIDGHRGVPLAATVPSGPLATAGVDER
ncbi:MAG TPA: TIGR03936 family radical SAM-associated protein [Microthrixaceae bacterium]|nr:TIGR03936 family radical SAM-associated protein [Microthrixaceae bacterium]